MILIRIDCFCFTCVNHFLFYNCYNHTNDGMLHQWIEICGYIAYTLIHRFDNSKEKLSTSDLFEYLQKAFRLNNDDFKSLLHQAKDRPVSDLFSHIIHQFLIYKGVASMLKVFIELLQVK